jgi:hypothetical protein
VTIFYVERGGHAAELKNGIAFSNATGSKGNSP